MADTPAYVELHCHSAYSFLDGASLPEELAYRAAQLGHSALALTDHNSLSGSMELAQAAPEAGVRAIHGAEVDIAPERTGEPSRHLTLLVADGRGWRNLCRILTAAHAHTRGTGGNPAKRGEPSIDLPTLLDHTEGLVCLTGCAGHGVHDEPTARRLLDAFGPERLRVELQRPYARHDRARNRALRQLARRLGVRTVASGDVHAHDRDRAALQDAFVALRHHSTLDASEPQRRGNHSHVLTTPQAMAARFADHPEAVRETLLLAERLCFDLTKDLGYSYPGAEDEDANRRLAELCRVRLQERYPRSAGGLRAEAQGRLESELRVIAKLGLAGFFLLHHEMLELAREVAHELRGVGGLESARALLAPGRGRGSSVSSLVCYLTGLSHIDPVANQLLLGRFLHEDLRGLPDIDLDFPRDIRAALIPRVHERFGNEHAALVAAFPTFRARGAIRELGKALGLPPGELERAARTADGWERHAEHDLPEDSPRWRWLAKLVDQAYGLPRHLSQHPGGMVISTRPLIDCCPTAPSAMAGRQMVQWDKDSCADAGFLKIDLLGLGMLSAVERCVDEIQRVRGVRVDLSRIQFDDADTFAAIGRADTVGVFQIESRAQMQSLKRTKPATLRDLTVQVAIVRPGPIQGGAVNPYIERRARLLADPGYEPPFEHPSLKDVLGETLGTIIFQDQVMQVSEAFAGFTAGEADGLRRAMSRKRSQAAMDSHRERFIAGAARHSGAGPRTAQRVWEMVSGFAGFGFPKAHATAFGLLAYQSTWLRVNYAPEFLCALLNEQPMGFYAPDSLVHEAQRRGIPVLGLDLNLSGVQCEVEALSVERQNAQRGVFQLQSKGGVSKGGVSSQTQNEKTNTNTPPSLGVRLGLGYIKAAKEEDVRALVAERERGGSFRDLGELAARTATRRGTLEALAWSGACDAIAGGRREALWQLGITASGQDTSGGVQLALPVKLPDPPSLRPLDRWQRLLADYASSGVTAHDHAMAALRERLRVPMLATSAQLARMPHGCAVTVAGLVIARQRPGTAKGTMFLLFEDEWGVINLIVPKAVYEARRALARAEPLLLAHGRLERHDGVANVIVCELEPLERFLDAPLVEQGASVSRLPRPSQTAPTPDAAETDDEREDAARVAAGMRAVAPPIQSFASGRRR
ncbi:MAG TPA: DNA polymerase III subunit alpha [Solirubrobacteraceae bacterium]|nr:DNA polymerase III subunit alpha [Solirubrobacteraceae bacterium]